jgi:hypothetical protein
MNHIKRKLPNSVPEVMIDFNARMTQSGYMATCRGTLEDLAEIGLSLDAAVGKLFIFSEAGGRLPHSPTDLICTGTIVVDPEFGFLAVEDENGVCERSELGEA